MCTYTKAEDAVNSVKTAQPITVSNKKFMYMPYSFWAMAG